MKKMTKLAVTVAAMSAMTIAAATMVSADGKYNSIANEKPATGISDGQWGGNNTDGWTFTVDDKKVIGWNQIDGVWYYFHKDYIMAREELVYLNGHTYYFNTDGSMMADGWVGFDRESEVLYDYNLDIDENIDDINNPVFKNPEDAYETVWMFFNENGTAKDDEWYQASSGLWFYFDDIIMACGDFDHEIGNAYYGFDENGYMLVGWAENYNDHYLKAPNKEEKTWYWYDANGKKFDASNNNNGDFAWKRIDGKWYCFYDQSILNVNGNNTVNNDYFSVGTLITNTYFYNGIAASNTYKDGQNYYYVDKTGSMATGVTIVDKDAQFVDANHGFDTKNVALGDYTHKDENWEIFFDTNNGSAKSDSWSNNRFYAGINSGEVYLFDSSNIGKNYTLDGKNHTVNEEVGLDQFAVTGYQSIVKGALVKNAFINKSDQTFYVDKYGDKATSTAVQVGYVQVSERLDSKGNVEEYIVEDFKVIDDFTPSTTSSVYRAYLVFDGKGVAYDDIDNTRTVSVGSKKYTSTDKSYKDIMDNYLGIEGPKDATLFFYKNKN